MIHKDWDINEEATGRVKNGKPIKGVTFQNGLNDIEPDGSFVACDMGIDALVDGVTTHKVKRGRYGELRFADTGEANKHLCKIKYKDSKGISFKYLGGDSALPDISNGKPKFTSSNGVEIEHIPTYKGVAINIIISEPLTAPFEHTFSIKTYGQDYTYAEVDGAIIATGDDAKTITMRANPATDANDDESPVTLVLTEVVGGLQTFKKVVDEAWLRAAAAPVTI